MAIQINYQQHYGPSVSKADRSTLKADGTTEYMRRYGNVMDMTLRIPPLSAKRWNQVITVLFSRRAYIVSNHYYYCRVKRGINR
jgi:hypothetical protein